MSGRTTPTRAIVLALLTKEQGRMSNLCFMAEVKPSAIKMAISRLRRDGFVITTERDQAGDPRYSIVKGPGSLAPGVWQCPECQSRIRLGYLTDHAWACPDSEVRLRQLINNRE